MDQKSLELLSVKSRIENGSGENILCPGEQNRIRRRYGVRNPSWRGSRILLFELWHAALPGVSIDIRLTNSLSEMPAIVREPRRARPKYCINGG